MTAADNISRRVMFALEFLDPVTKRIVTEGLQPSIAGFSPPLKGHNGRFVWLEESEPAQRDLAVTLAVSNPMYGQPDIEDLQFDDVPPNDGQTRPERLLERVELPISPNYVPPDGLIGVRSMLIDAEESGVPIPKARCMLAFFHDGEQRFTSERVAITDERGAFAALADDLDDIVPRASPPGSDGNLLGWLAVDRSDDLEPIKFTGLLPLFRGRMTQLRRPISWAALNEGPPDPPQQ